MSEIVLPTTGRVVPSAAPAARAGRRWQTLTLAATWVGFVVVVLLGAFAPIMRTGDAHQYYAMAINLAAGEPPALTPAEVADYKGWLTDQPAASNFPGGALAIDQPRLIVDGRQEFSHFWLYPALAAPLVAMLEELNAPIGYAFLIVNAVLLAFALWQVQAAYSAVVSLLLLASPLIWFINKAQVELFTVALLSVAMAQAARGRWAWAALAAAVAATQNIPILAAVLVFWAAGALVWLRAAPRCRPGTGSLVAIGLTIIAAAAHPAYYWLKFGVVTPQQLNNGIGNEPARMLSRYLAVLIDPDLGFLAWLPVHAALAALGFALIWWWPRAAASRGTMAPDPTLNGGAAGADATPAPGMTRTRRGRGDAWSHRRLAGLCSVVIGVWFVLVFAQTTNVNSGGTIHVSRYALWLLPLTLPFLATAAAWLGGYLPGLLPLTGIIGLVIYGWAFRPAQLEFYVYPSPQSATIALLAPELYRPVPEIFAERYRHQDGGIRGSAAMPSCSLILLAARDQTQPCALTAAEQAQADALLADGWSAVWIGRPGPFQLAPGEVRGAVPAV